MLPSYTTPRLYKHCTAAVHHSHCCGEVGLCAAAPTCPTKHKTIIPRPCLLLPTNQMQKSHIEPLRNVSSLHPHEFHFSIPGVQNTVKELELHHRTHCIQILVLPTIIFTPHPCPTLPDISQATPCTSALPADGLPSLCTLHTAVPPWPQGIARLFLVAWVWSIVLVAHR